MRTPTSRRGPGGVSLRCGFRTSAHKAPKFPRLIHVDTTFVVARSADLPADLGMDGWAASMVSTPATKEGDRTMPRISLLSATLLPPTVAIGLLFAAAPASANVAVTQVSSDPFTDAQAQHRTEVEPATFTFGNTIVSAFQ